MTERKKKSAMDIVACSDCLLPFARYELSQKGLCSACSYKRIKDAVSQMVNKEGPIYNRWLEGMLKYAKKLKKEKDNAKTKALGEQATT